jgi:5-methylcytosine-specific restriction endonuclease McrA
MSKGWSEEESNRLTTLFPNMGDKEIADILGRSIKSIQCRARRLQLYKSENFIKKVLAETSKNISSGDNRHQFKKGGDPAIYFGSGSSHPRWIKDRSKIKGPRRRRHRFPPLIMVEVKTRQESKCNICNNYTEFGEFDHIIPVCIGGDSWIDNCQFLCSDCHREKTSFEQGISNNFVDLDSLQEAYSFIARNLI